MWSIKETIIRDYFLVYIVHICTDEDAATKACELNCEAKNRDMTVTLNETMIDGTPCRAGTRDMCIAGKCTVSVLLAWEVTLVVGKGVVGTRCYIRDEVLSSTMNCVFTTLKTNLSY